MGKSRGFTLIELVVTIVVMAIIATMAAPSMLNLVEKNRYERNTRDLLSTLSQAKSQAILSRGNVNANLASSNANTLTSMNWAVSGYTALSISPSVSASTLIYNRNGLISNITADTTITLCNSKLKIRKQVIVTILGASILRPDTNVSAC